MLLLSLSIREANLPSTLVFIIVYFRRTRKKQAGTASQASMGVKGYFAKAKTNDSKPFPESKHVILLGSMVGTFGCGGRIGT